MKEYEIITKSNYGQSTFLTKGKNNSTALRNLISRSYDFRMFLNNNPLTIKIKEMKKHKR